MFLLTEGECKRSGQKKSDKKRKVDGFLEVGGQKKRYFRKKTRKY